eukprot:1458520-Prorocentrum_lima.AAC.1
MEELRMLEADEKAAAYKRPSWTTKEAVLGSVAAVDMKGDEKRTNNTSSNTSYLTPKPPVCKFYMKTGKC